MNREEAHPLSEDSEEKEIKKTLKQHFESVDNTVTDIQIEDLLQERLSLLRQIIEEIYAEINKRKELRNGALEEMETELKQFSVLLNDIVPLGRINVSGEHLDILNARRIHLEKSIARLNELRRKYKIETWKDIVALKRDLFKHLPEYTQLIRLKKVID